ncbi:AcrR family transcriptional regulator [Microbacterium sp. SORGH_AS428]|uniref:TetR family transcriptional regulator n=1 Tax=Microbacterium sp. SORGH_AS_0428 TaxID=3041788 RepID=UPI002864F9DF|nr:TetR family transcriptional regulator [Microbacterium sp. SORGH_AS_0428]MDR6199245.1 AcrR family transcriptional regulator [Microbacterium sp. SORGH_AS_0428]
MPTQDEQQDSGRRVHNDSSQTGRARRIPRDELRRRVLDAAADLLADGAVSVGLHQLNMEELIRRVGVPRSSAFAAFGGKDQLLSALMLRLLEPRGPHPIGYSAATVQIATAVFEQYSDHLVGADGEPDPVGIERVLQESVRRAIGQNVLDTMASTEWKNYMALSVSVSSLPVDQQAEVRRALAASETRFLAEIADIYQRVLARVEREPVPGVTWLQIAAAGASLIEGMASKRLVGIEGIDDVVLREGIDGEEVPWELPALAFWSLLMGLTRAVGEPRHTA